MKNEWIPLTPETLPPDGKEILFTTDCRGIVETRYGFCSIYWDESKNVEYCEFTICDTSVHGVPSFEKVTAWMLWPDPYEN